MWPWQRTRPPPREHGPPLRLTRPTPRRSPGEADRGGKPCGYATRLRKNSRTSPANSSGTSIAAK